MSLNRRMAWAGRDLLQITRFQPPCHGQGRLFLDQAAPDPEESPETSKAVLLSGGSRGRATCPVSPGAGRLRWVPGEQDGAGCTARSPAVNQANEVSALTLQNRTLM